MNNIPKDKIEQELLLLINTPPTYQLNNNILNLKSELGSLNKRSKHKRNKTKHKKRGEKRKKKKTKRKH